MEDYKLKIANDQYLEAVKWIRFIWGFRMAIMTGILSALGFAAQYNKFPELIFLFGFIIFFVDYACTVVIAPWVYSALYIENYIFPKLHHIVNNWNLTFGVPVELANQENSNKQRKLFRNAYVKAMFKTKLIWYVFILITLVITYVFLEQR